MLTENYIDDKIIFPKGQFLEICKTISLHHGKKDVDWFNLFCGKNEDGISEEETEVMHFRHRKETLNIRKEVKLFDHHDALDYVIDRGGKVGDFLELYGSKVEYPFVDVKWFVDNCIRK